MSTSLSRRFRRVVAGTAATALAAGSLVLVAGPAQAAPKPIDDATFTWGLSGYAQKGIFGPWNFKDLTGNVALLQGSVSGGTQTEYAVAPVPATSMPTTPAGATANAVKFTGGEGAVDPATGATTLAWDGSYTVNAYPAMYGAPNEIYTDPELTVAADGSGELTMDVTIGAGVDMSGNPTLAEPLGRLKVATFDDGDLSNVTASGFRATPDYQSVSVSGEGINQNVTCTTAGGATGWWGSWPAEFVNAVPAAIQPHFYSTGCGGLQDNKPPLPFDVSYTVPADPAPATVTVSDTTIPSTGEHEITVTGSGFAPSLATGTRPPLAGKAAGTYVVLGTVADVWKPSAGATSAARKAITQKWAVTAADMNTIGGAAAGAIELKADGTFTTTFSLSKAAIDAAPDKLANLGFYTYAGSGATQAAYETFTPITFVDPEPEPVPAVASTTAISAPTTVVYGRGGTATVAVKSTKAVTGKVQLLDGARSLGVKGVSGGKATFVLPTSLSVGTHRLTARFTPADAKVVKASATVRNLAVAKVTTKAAVKVSKKPTRTKAGKATVTISGTPKANGRVTIVVKGKGIKKTVRATVRNGKVVVKLPKLKKKGTYTLTATFSATGTHTGAKKAIKVKVTR